ncbi:hypothetical protein A3C23_02410 [Candidatus Roizmanbacteria bacterium RIFCSPHIGHO2_02_FULL_37_13b]|uniref:Transposase IS200-like domain-containing protein n=1 Tax=Candidatus Roizmanbacteria bacterium RIFCSPLOWO2_02_FULL_36_11 TaxID=1802071 RepID=A0A1F7JIQ8_9BACT|nr:MAG: hypothetical protein A3C23_02410 [Candidatus Roizmanbacteria bacterium RIFCSPHIGHO2_02_FULL_37_13b]OGK55487.1 MAG: hypothetical protein A3H78_04955 [Candidatus Roizmanbacteria bacterium RIFCSPLOWO2_02_FULL_36_11]
MPRRRIILASGEYYHIFNKTLLPQNIFFNKRNNDYFIAASDYYRHLNVPVQFAKYNENKKAYSINGLKLVVSIYAYALMPNHFHFLLKQHEDNGIRTFIQRLSNSYAHFYNLKYSRKGALFQGPFKSVRIESEEQLLHVVRYIDLNATTSYLVEDPADFIYSSYRTHIGLFDMSWIEKRFILDHFGSFNKYKKFVLDNKDYQRSLKKIDLSIIE